MNTKIKRGSWVVTVPLAAAAIGYVVLVFLPGRRSVSEAREQLELKQDYIARAAGVATALQAAHHELNKAQAYNSSWEERAPAKGGLSALYGKINALAKAFGRQPSAIRSRLRKQGLL